MAGQVHCVVFWNERTQRVDGYHACTRDKAKAKKLLGLMKRRGIPHLRIIERKSAPRVAWPILTALKRYR